jgi:hypothetical protein
LGHHPIVIFEVANFDSNLILEINGVAIQTQVKPIGVVLAFDNIHIDGKIFENKLLNIPKHLKGFIHELFMQRE